jgi:hypothetical protein
MCKTLLLNNSPVLHASFMSDFFSSVWRVIGLVFSGQREPQFTPAAPVWLSQLVSRMGIKTSSFSALPVIIHCTVTNAFNFGHNSVIKIFASRIQKFFSTSANQCSN